MEGSGDIILRDDVDDKLGFIQKAYDLRQYDVVVKECCSMFEVVFKKIFAEAVVNFPYQERIKLMETEKKIGNSQKGVQEFGLGQLVGLFRESDLMKKWAKYSNRDLGLIDTLNFNSIVELRNRLVHDGADCSHFEADLVYNYLKNLLASYGFVNLEKAISSSFEKREESSGTDKREKDNLQGDYVNIKLIENRGIIINEADGSRNISFKVDTINSMLESMYNSVKKISDEETAQKVLFNIGYDSGKKFGESMNKKWELEEITYGTKISKWCDFDSLVGWGKFNNNLTISVEDGSIDGVISISENFLCSNRRKKDVKLCDYIKGYSTGVLEELLSGVPVEMICDCSSCPQDNPFKKECRFELKIN